MLVPYSQYGYKTGSMYDKSYKIEEDAFRFYVTVEIIARCGDRTAGVARTLSADFPNLAKAQEYLRKKI